MVRCVGHPPITNIAVVVGRTARTMWLVRAFGSRRSAGEFVEELHDIQRDYAHASAAADTGDALLYAIRTARGRLWALGERSAHAITALDWDVVEIPLMEEL